MSWSGTLILAFVFENSSCLFKEDWFLILQIDRTVFCYFCSYLKTKKNNFIFTVLIMALLMSQRKRDADYNCRFVRIVKNVLCNK